MIPNTSFDPELLRRYDRPGPRYTSYPTAPQFSDQFGEAELREVVQLSNALDGLLNANVARVTFRQNVIIQQVSSWAAIAAVPTIITGIYGMNFRHMPELDWRLGYPMALGMMALMSFVLFRVFRRRDWL